MANPILARYYRGQTLESWSRGSWIVLTTDQVIDSGGDPHAPCYPRSSLKPLQVLPLAASGALDKLALTSAERACLTASHSGDEGHIACVRSVQRKANIPEEALRCGPHPPLDVDAAARLAARGERPGPIHNNCSGKHTGFLMRARELGAPLAGYLDPAHPVQQEVRDVLSELTGIPSADLLPGVDGCGAPNWPLPLRTLAALFRDLANPVLLPRRLSDGADQLFRAVNEAPHFLAGRDRFDTALLSARPGCFLGKCGAEGVFAIGVRAGAERPPMGIAIKVDDGAARGYERSLPWLLVKLGLLSGTEPQLATFFQGEIENTQGLVVGTTRVVGSMRGEE